VRGRAVDAGAVGGRWLGGNSPAAYGPSRRNRPQRPVDDGLLRGPGTGPEDRPGHAQWFGPTARIRGVRGGVAGGVAGVAGADRYGVRTSAALWSAAPGIFQNLRDVEGDIAPDRLRKRDLLSRYVDAVNGVAVLHGLGEDVEALVL